MMNPTVARTAREQARQFVPAAHLDAALANIDAEEAAWTADQARKAANSARFHKAIEGRYIDTAGRIS